MRYWTIAGVVIAFLSLCGTAAAWVIKRLRSRPVITYELATSIPFIPDLDYIKAASGLSILHHGEKVADPHLLVVELVSKYRKDIPTRTFDQDRPLAIDVGTPIVTLLETQYKPQQAPYPETTTTESALQIRPGLIRNRQTFTFFILADGPSRGLTCENPLIGITLRHADSQERLARIRFVKKVTTWAAVIFVVFYLVTQPTSAGYLLTSGFHGLHSAGNALANFINSLAL